MGSLARKFQRRREREDEREARRAALKDARLLKKPPPRKQKKRRGGMRISTPRVGVTFSMGRGFVRFGCPVCRTVLYVGTGTPHEAGMKQIEGHIVRCRTRKELVDTLELVAVWKLEDEEVRALLAT